MLPFTCGLRSFRSKCSLSTKVVRTLISRTQRQQGRFIRSICVAGLHDGMWMNHRVQESLKKSETRMFASDLTLSPAFSSILSSALENGGVLVSLEVSGEDDEVTCSAAKKRKHWKTSPDEG